MKKDESLDWVVKIITRYEPRKVIAPTKEPAIAYAYDGKKKTLRFLSKEEAEELSKKGKPWKFLTQ